MSSRNTLHDIPEIVGLDSRRELVRIPPDLDVPLTPRVRRILDTEAFQRLKQISQLGLVGKVYPAANHTRFEHSLGVYRLALLQVKELAHDERFVEIIQPEDAERFLATALLHDLGHWPFCHPIEDLRLEGVPHHESFARRFLLGGEIEEALSEDWGIDASEIASLLDQPPTDQVSRLLSSMLSGPIDIDKMDYLFRDSLHAGVPYGRNFDQNRLIGSLRLNANGDGLAISSKGKTAAELMVFARYVMFSEVYWHHAVRASTSMFQRAFFLLYQQLDLDTLFLQGDWELAEAMRKAAVGTPAAELLDGLFGSRRKLFKRLGEFAFTDDADLYRRIAGRPYSWLAMLGERLAEAASLKMGVPVAKDELLIDAPPSEREVQFRVDVFFPKQDRYRPLADVSPVIRALAEEQFDDYVKRVRIFGSPRIADALRNSGAMESLLCDALDSLDAEGCADV